MASCRSTWLRNRDKDAGVEQDVRISSQATRSSTSSRSYSATIVVAIVGDGRAGRPACSRRCQSSIWAWAWATGSMPPEVYGGAKKQQPRLRPNEVGAFVADRNDPPGGNGTGAWASVASPRLTLSAVLRHVPSGQKCQPPLMVLSKRRPVTPEAAGSSPAPP